MKNKTQLQSNVYFNKMLLRHIDEFLNIIFNDCLDTNGKFDNTMFEDLKCIYEKKIYDHFNNIYDSYGEVYKEKFG